MRPRGALNNCKTHQYKAQRPLSGAVRTTNPSDSPPAHRAASDLGARPATASDGPLPSHRLPGGRYAAGAPGADAFASLLTQSPSPANTTSMGFAGARPSTAAAAVGSSNSNSTWNPSLNLNHKLLASGTPTGAAALPAVPSGGVFYSCLGRREGAYNPCPKWARIYRLMTESGSKAFPASRAPEV